MGEKIVVFRKLAVVFCCFYIFQSVRTVKDYDISHDKAELPANGNALNIVADFEEHEPIFADVMVEETDEDIGTSKREAEDHGLSNATKIRILDLHNLYRSNVTPPAGNMNFLEWDDELENLAQLWADTCDFKHGKPAGSTYPEHYGQNLYMGIDVTGILGVWMWYEEYKHYSFKNQSCEEGQQCGHYLAMVWAPSNKIGCAMSRCGYRYYLVCHYSPSVLKGLPLYDVSKPCSQCSPGDGTLCYNNLCLTKEQCRRNLDKCAKAKCSLDCKNCGTFFEDDCRCDCADGWDSRDCSRLCIDSHERCGKRPGFTNKATCSLNKYAVADSFCRKMCGRCLPVRDNLTFVSNMCCMGKLCPDGYVLDLERKPCRCILLCPGPQCDEDGGPVKSKRKYTYEKPPKKRKDSLEGSGVNYRTCVGQYRTLAILMLILYLFD